MSDDAINMVWVVGILAFGAGLVWTGAEYGLAVAAAVASVVLTSAWAVAVIVLLLKILDRLPAAEKEAAAPARKDEPAAAVPAPALTGAQFSPGLYEVKRDEQGRILADE